MENFPKSIVFKTPEGYFEKLPNRVLERNNQKKIRTLSMVRMTAAAAVITIGVFFFVIKNELMVSKTLEADLEQEIDLYINSGYWQAEDILSFSENPNLILDEIIEEEWGVVESTQPSSDIEEWW
ncbi:hypothetical protein MMU07_04835 [Aquiflexum sp. LQ15W]|uniref:hypothetical protein n=1 Tax=Cognataquiflexum nitidum TaxID=2922272 RepID=UPI001F1422A9|nr:hypothetical protein [Cognataquiflexum nitidum]MCH6198891.1 hypothetical protein [Cognataquiflexum nitidum]